MKIGNKNKKTVRLPGYSIEFIERKARELKLTESRVIRTLVSFGIDTYCRMERDCEKSVSQVQKLGSWARLSERYTDWLVARSLVGVWF